MIDRFVRGDKTLTLYNFIQRLVDTRGVTILIKRGEIVYL